MFVVSITDTLEQYEHLVLILIKTKWNEQLLWLESLANAGRHFKVIHLADEFLSDPIHFYFFEDLLNQINTKKDTETETKTIEPNIIETKTIETKTKNEIVRGFARIE